MEITEKKLKSILTEQRKEFQHHIGVLVEEFTSQMKLIAESMAGMQKQLIALREMVAKNTEDIEALREMVVKNTEDIEMIKFDTQFIKRELKQKVNYDEFSVLERRVSLLETKIRK